jgi:hypothetical protein
MEQTATVMVMLTAMTISMTIPMRSTNRQLTEGHRR